MRKRPGARDAIRRFLHRPALNPYSTEMYVLYFSASSNGCENSTLLGASLITRDISEPEFVFRPPNCSAYASAS